MKLLKDNKLLFTLSLVCVFAVVGMILALCIPKEAEQEPFVPPPFDETAIVGTPTIAEDFGYQVLYRDGMPFKVGVCGKVLAYGNTAQIYFTNIVTNTLWLKLRVLDGEGTILGETGLIRPGEYIESVYLLKPLEKAENVVLKIMSYYPETYESAGAIVITPQIIIEK